MRCSRPRAALLTLSLFGLAGLVAPAASATDTPVRPCVAEAQACWPCQPMALEEGKTASQPPEVFDRRVGEAAACRCAELTEIGADAPDRAAPVPEPVCAPCPPAEAHEVEHEAVEAQQAKEAQDADGATVPGNAVAPPDERCRPERPRDPSAGVVPRPDDPQAGPRPAPPATGSPAPRPDAVQNPSETVVDPEAPPTTGALPLAPPPATGHVEGEPEPSSVTSADVGRWRPSGARSTSELLGPATDGSACLPSVGGSTAGLVRFPVGGEAWYQHDWHAPRSVPYPHLHEGTDIFAAAGTPVRAPDAGFVRVTEGPVGGLAVHVVGDDGTFYYLAHLSGLAAGLVTGTQVATGEVVGYIGTSGNAKGGPAHLHIQVHPGGGEPVDPKPILDGWLDDAALDVITASGACAEPEELADESPAAAPVAPDRAPVLSSAPSRSVSEPVANVRSTRTDQAVPLAPLWALAPLSVAAYAVRRTRTRSLSLTE